MFPISPMATTPTRVSDNSSPSLTPASTRSGSASASPQPQQWSNDTQMPNIDDFSSYMETPPTMFDCADPYLNSNLVYGGNQSESSQPFGGDFYTPTNALLLNPYGTNSQHSQNAYHTPIDNRITQGHSAGLRTSPIPRIQIDTGFTSPSLPIRNMNTSSHASPSLSAYSTPSGQKSPYTPPSISPAAGHALIIDPGRQSPHSPTSYHALSIRHNMVPTTPKSPYSPNQLYPSSPSSSVSGYADMALMNGNDAHYPMVPRTPQPVPSVQDIAKMYPGYNFMVPQRTYRPNTQSDRRRYVEEVQLEHPIMFFVSGPDGLGISCRDALNSRFIRLRDRDDQMFINRGPSVSIRIQWPGYAPWSRQIPTRDFRTPPGPITRGKLAKNVAKTVDRFITEMTTKPMEEDADLRWRVGNHHITVDQLELIGLQHVSMGSWQVHLRLRPTL